MAQITLNSSGVASSGSLLLQTNGTTTQATVDTSGNLGLGVTPSSWDSTYKALQVGSRSMFYGIGSEANMANNAYYNAGYKYVANSAAGLYTIDANVHKWYYAASGTAGNAITFTQAMTLDASGNLLVGTTSTSYSSANRTVFALGSGANGSLIDFQVSGATSDGYIYFDGTNATIENSNAGYLRFSTNAAERARIDSSGNLLVGTTSADIIGANGDGVTYRPASKSFSVNATSSAPCNFGRSTTSGTLVNFFYNAAVKGTISTDGSTTAYNTSSDYRLKHDIAPMTGALAKVAALKPVTYKWNLDNSDGEGFIAHELQEVVPQCVTGEKDAVDADGNPVYQGIDTSFLVATLTAALQEAHGLIKDLQTRITALEQA